MSYLITGLLIAWLLYKLQQGGDHLRGDSKPLDTQQMNQKDALEVLGLNEGATADDIQQAYQSLLKKLHPDTGGSDYLTQQIIKAKRALDDK